MKNRFLKNQTLIVVATLLLSGAFTLVTTGASKKPAVKSAAKPAAAKPAATGPQRQGVFISSDTQVFLQKQNMMKAIGNVVIKRDTMTATSPEALIVLDAKGTPEKVIFYKGARLVQDGQIMKGEKITLDLATGNIYAENRTETQLDSKDASGKPTSVKVNSNFQELDSNSGTLFANGNVRLKYEDYNAIGPKAVFISQNKTLDHIVMNGRSQIEDNERKVTGDKVVITINPRQFNAQGHVTTFIKGKNDAPAKAPAKAAPAKGAKPTLVQTQPAAKPVATVASNAEEADFAREQRILEEGPQQ